MLPAAKKEAWLTADRLCREIEYDRRTGIFRWRWSMGCIHAGDIAGSVTDGGYLIISIEGRRFMAHRLAWLCIHACWPTLFIDHINGNRLDNRIANLREANYQQNLANRAAQKGRQFKGIMLVRLTPKTEATH